MVVGAGEKFNHGKSNCVTDSLSPDHLQQEPNCIATLIALVQQVPTVSGKKLSLIVSYEVLLLMARPVSPVSSQLFSFRYPTV